MALPPAFTATTKSPRTELPLELDELLEELDEVEDELLVLEVLELLELEVLVELEELLELEELELLLELLLLPPQPASQILAATSASDKIRLLVVDLFMNVNHSIIGVLSGDYRWGDISQISKFNKDHQGNLSECLLFIRIMLRDCCDADLFFIARL